MIFVRAFPRDPATGEVTAVRLAGGGVTAAYQDATGPYHAGIMARPKFAAKLGYGAQGWTGATTPQTTAIAFQSAVAGLVHDLAQLFWRDADIEIDELPGDIDVAAAPVRLLTGTVADIAVDEGVMTITAADKSRALQAVIAADSFAGTGGIEGDESAKGRIKRRSFGPCFNVEARLLSRSYNIYEVGDPARQLLEIGAVRDMGREGPLQFVTWAGTKEATFAALIAASAPQGGAVAAPSIACIKWWTEPQGPLTADVVGEIAGGYAEMPVTIAERLLAGTGIAIANAMAARALVTASCCYHVDSAIDVASALDQLLLGVGLIWSLRPDGQIVIRKWGEAPPAESLRARFVAQRQTLSPVYRRTLNFARNHRVLAPAEISAALLGVDGKPVPVIARYPVQPSIAWPEGSLYYDAANRPTMVAKSPWTFEGVTLTFNGARLVTGSFVDVRDPEIATAIEQATAAEVQAAAAAQANLTLAGAVDGVVDTAAEAKATADAARAAADAATDELAIMLDDGQLSIDEKIRIIIPASARLEGAYQALLIAAQAVNVPTPDATAARGAWLALRDAINPPYNFVGAASPVDRAALQAAISTYESALNALSGAIAAKAATTATVQPDGTIDNVQGVPTPVANEAIALAPDGTLTTATPDGPVALGSVPIGAINNSIAAVDQKADAAATTATVIDGSIFNQQGLPTPVDNRRVLVDGVIIDSTGVARSVENEDLVLSPGGYLTYWRNGQSVNLGLVTLPGLGFDGDYDADNTARSVPRNEPAALSLTIDADWTGVVAAGQLPKSFSVARLRGANNQSLAATWSIPAVVGIDAASVTVAQGVVTIATGAALGASATITVRSMLDGVAIDSVISVTKRQAPMPQQQTAGSPAPTNAQASSFGAINSTVFADIATMTLRSGAAGTLSAVTDLLITMDEGAPTGTFDVEFRWRSRPSGGAWTNHAAFAASQSPASMAETEPSAPTYYWVADGYERSTRAIAVAASADHELALQARLISGTRTIYFSNTISGAGS